MQAGAAVVAEVGQVMHVSLGEVQATGHGGKDRAEPFAVTAGVADMHLPVDFGLVNVQQGNQALLLRALALRGDLYDFRRLHGTLQRLL